MLILLGMVVPPVEVQRVWASNRCAFSSRLATTDDPHDPPQPPGSLHGQHRLYHPLRLLPARVGQQLGQDGRKAVTGAGPLERLAAMGRAYRANALANRSYYTVMFQRPIPGFEPSPEAYQASLVPLHALADTVADCIDAGAMHIASVLWAATHGAVSLELAGYEGAVDAEHLFDDVNAAAAAWFMTPGRALSK
jgi:hypothetical protein